MSKKFDAMWPLLVKIEGGYVNDPDDPGGETKYGISKKNYPEENISSLTEDKAKQIYIRDYWNEYVEELSQPIFNLWFLTSINIGKYEATIELQYCVDNEKTFMKIDGILGQFTAYACNSMPQNVLLSSYKANIINYYKKLATENPKNKKFLTGWLNRVNAIS